MQEISEPEYKNLTSLEELEKMKGLPLATSGNAASISSIFWVMSGVLYLVYYILGSNIIYLTHLFWTMDHVLFFLNTAINFHSNYVLICPKVLCYI